MTIKRYRLFVDDFDGQKQIHGTGCYCQADVDNYPRIGYWVIDEHPPESERDFLDQIDYERCYFVQVGRYL